MNPYFWFAELSSFPVYIPSENGLFSHIGGISDQMLDIFFLNEIAYLHNNYNETTVLDLHFGVAEAVYAEYFAKVCVVSAEFHNVDVVTSGGKVPMMGVGVVARVV